MISEDSIKRVLDNQAELTRSVQSEPEDLPINNHGLHEYVGKQIKRVFPEYEYQPSYKARVRLQIKALVEQARDENIHVLAEQELMRRIGELTMELYS